MTKRRTSRGFRASANHLLNNERFTSSLIIFILLLGAASVILEAPTSRFTDEYAYMPFALDDLVHLRNPYSTLHSENRWIQSPFGDYHLEWNTTDPYLPLVAVFQVPYLDYRWTSLAAYGLLLWQFRKQPFKFLLFANPFVFPLAASGFNDFVVLALLAWGQNARRSLPTWFACGSKQFALPITIIIDAIRGERRSMLMACLITLLVVLPFIFWSPADFWRSAIVQHFVGPNSKISDLYHFYNYGLYPLYLLAVLSRRDRV